MATKGTQLTTGGEEAAKGRGEKPRSLAIAEHGVDTGEEFAFLMSALIADIIAGRVNPSQANAIIGAGGKLLKIVEMQHKYGKPTANGKEAKTLILTQG